MFGVTCSRRKKSVVTVSLEEGFPKVGSIIFFNDHYELFVGVCHR